MQQSLSPSTLLDAWEQGMTLPAVQRALLLLVVGFPEKPRATLAQHSIGQRNAHLLTLRERLFGPRFASTAHCPQCTEQVEFSFTTSDIGATPPEELDEPLTLERAGYTVLFRLPNSTDLVALSGNGDPARVEQMLMARCLLSTSYGEQSVGGAALPAEVVTAVIEAMDRADPLANIQMELTCPACDHRWFALLDLPTYLWYEVDAWARRVLYEVHALASAYGWHERDILNMRPWRRQIYMGMIGR